MGRKLVPGTERVSGLAAAAAPRASRARARFPPIAAAGVRGRACRRNGGATEDGVTRSATGGADGWLLIWPTQRPPPPNGTPTLRPSQLARAY